MINCLEICKYKGVNTKIFHGYLTYNPSYCDRCGHINNGYEDIIAWGWKKNCKVKVTKVCGYNALLLLDKRRFKCNHCNKTFTARKLLKNNVDINIIIDSTGLSKEEIEKLK